MAQEIAVPTKEEVEVIGKLSGMSEESFHDENLSVLLGSLRKLPTTPVTIIDVGPTNLRVKSLVISGVLKRRGVRFLPRQVIRRVMRAANKVGVVNPFDSN